MEKLLRKAGFLTINCAMSRPFDIIAIKDNIAIPMELKQRDGHWSDEQREFQMELAVGNNTGFMFVQQLHERNKRGFKIKITHFIDDLDGPYADTAIKVVRSVVKALKGSLKGMKRRPLDDV